MADYQFWTLLAMLTAGFGWMFVYFNKKFDKVDERFIFLEGKLNDIDRRLTIVETILSMIVGKVSIEKKQ